MEILTTLQTIESAIIETNTPVAININGVEKMTIQLTEAGIVNNRSGALTVTGSVDGTTYVTFNKLITNVVNTNGQFITRVASVTRAAAGTDLIFVDMEDTGFQFIKILLTVNDGADPTGNFTIKLLSEY